MLLACLLFYLSAIGWCIFLLLIFLSTSPNKENKSQKTTGVKSLLTETNVSKTMEKDGAIYTLNTE